MATRSRVHTCSALSAPHVCVHATVRVTQGRLAVARNSVEAAVMCMTVGYVCQIRVLMCRAQSATHDLGFKPTYMRQSHVFAGTA